MTVRAERTWRVNVDDVKTYDSGKEEVQVIEKIKGDITVGI